MIRSHIMVHHSLTPDGVAVSWGAIERFHRETQGWNDIGYHAGVELTGNAALGRYGYQGLIGRSTDEKAAACPQGNMNEIALHACVVGNYDMTPPSAAILEVLVRRVLRPWMRIFSIPASRIVGHRDYNPHKTCPGTRFDLDALRRMVA